MSHPSTQLPLSILAVKRWYEDVDTHSERCDSSIDCAGCLRLQERMKALRIKYAALLREV